MQSDISGVISNIQRFCLHDGPGVRTVVFLKGCPLKCPWCANPESQSNNPELMYLQINCRQCGACVTSCSRLALKVINNKIVINYDSCDVCLECVKVCPNYALQMSGRRQSIDEICQAVVKDRNFYEESGGGVTLSGGEPLSHGKFVVLLLKKLKALGVNTAIETSGNVAEKILEEILPFVDLFLFDLKHPQVDNINCIPGANGELIIKNLTYLVKEKKQLTLRYTLIPDFNLNNTTINQLIRLTNELKIKSIELIPFHRLGASKYDQLGRAYEYADITPIPKIKIDAIYQKLIVETQADINIIL